MHTRSLTCLYQSQKVKVACHRTRPKVLLRMQDNTRLFSRMKSKEMELEYFPICGALTLPGLTKYAYNATCRSISLATVIV